MTHKHRFQRDEKIVTRPWTQCVGPSSPHNGTQHGGFVYTQECACGAKRDVEVSDTSALFTPWREA